MVGVLCIGWKEALLLRQGSENLIDRYPGSEGNI